MATVNFPTTRLNSDDSTWTDDDPLQEGDQITRNSIVFEWNGSAWIKLTVFDLDRIPDLSTDKITSGIFNTSRIPDLATSKITSGSFDADRIPNLNANKITSGTIASARLSLTASDIPSLSASKITSGTIASARLSLTASDIPSLSTSKITSGSFDADRIPNLDASKITGGSFDADRIPNLNANKITSGTIASARLSLTASDIPSLSASKITSGTFSTERLVAGGTDNQVLTRTSSGMAWEDSQGITQTTADTRYLRLNANSTLTGSGNNTALLIDGSDTTSASVFNIRTNSTGAQKAFQASREGQNLAFVSFEGSLGGDNNKPGIAMGSGTGGRDVHLYRDAANTWKMPDKLIVNELEIDSSATLSTTQGNLGIETFARTGNSTTLTPAKLASGGTENQVLTRTSTGMAWSNSGVVTTFISLTDTPSSFTANQFAKVNSDGDAIVFSALAAGDIPSLATSKITSGIFSVDRIPNLSASKITSGTIASARLSLTASDIPSLSASKITSGTIASARLSLVASDIPNLSASKITSGTIASARLSLTASDIPNLDTDKITSGTFSTSRIPNLNANKITSGTIASARLSLVASDIPSLSTSKITSGSFDADRIPNLDASKITGGTFNTSRIPSLATSKITSGIFNTARLAAGGTDNQVLTRTSSGMAWENSQGVTASQLETWWGDFETTFVSSSSGITLTLESDEGTSRSAIISGANIGEQLARIGGSNNQVLTRGSGNTVSWTTVSTGISTSDVDTHIIDEYDLLIQTGTSGFRIRLDNGTTSLDSNYLSPQNLGNLLTNISGSNNQVLTRSGSAVSWTSSTFIGLTDTPSSITTNRFVKGNSAGNAIEFVALEASDIPNLATSKITSGTFGVDRIPDLSASKITSGTIASARLSLSASDIPNLATSKITSGTFGVDRIPDLSASKITSGTIASARLSLSASDIPNLSASKITSGTIASARLSLSASDIPSLAASKITSGSFDADRIPNLNANKITSGTLSTARIPNLSASKITSGTFSTARLASGGTDDQVLTRTASGMAWEDPAGGGVFEDGTDGVYYNGSKNVGIGLTNPTHKLQVDGSINASGEITAYSDEKLKENIKSIENPLSKILNMRGVLYNKIGETEQKMGLIAQEVQEVVPQVINNGEYLSISYGNLVGLLIEAIKEQENKINRLEDLIENKIK